MKQRLIYIIGVFLLLLSPVLSQAQISYQYWIDDNKEAAVSGTTTDGAALSLTIDAAGLTTGVHFLNMRAGENKKWGTVYRKLFAIPRDAQAASSGMKGYEYWIDNDYAHRVSATVSNSTEQAIEASIDVNNLSTGIHFFNMRVQDANGTWGSVQRQIFSIPRDQQAASSNLITGYRYGFGNDLTTVTLGSPVSEYKLTQQFDVTAPPVTTIDDDCHFSFLGDEATMIRDVETTFALTFTDESNAMSSPIGTTCKLTDTQTSDILTLSVPGSLTIPAHITGGYTVMKFTIETATTYVLTSTTTCSLRLYSSEGAFIKTVKPEQLAIGSLQDLEAGTYYAVAYGNAAETSLSIALETPIVYTVATPVITNDGDVVTITTTTPDATIYYTVDGSIPTAESTLYTEPFTVTENGTIFAIAKRDGYKDSEIALLEVDWIVVGTPCGYAIFDSETSTLTFKYGIIPEGDNVWETDDTGNTAYPKWPRTITTVVFDASFAQARPASTYGWFSSCSKLTQINGIGNLNTSNVTNMEQMFWNCIALSSLDVSSFNTSQVTTMSNMFGSCSGLTSLNVSGFNTVKVTDMSSMFYGCKKLITLNVSNFNTANVTDMNNMFSSCSGLTSLNVTNFVTANVTNMRGMFSGCSGLSTLNVSKFNTSNVTNMLNMFTNCSGLTSLNLSNFNTSNVTDMRQMFMNCSGLTSLNVSSFNTANVTDMSDMFNKCSKLTSLNLSDFNTSNVTNMSEMFSDCSSLTSLNVTSFNTANVTNMWEMFYGCSGLTSLNVSNFNTSNVTNMYGMFWNCSGLTSLNVSNFDTSNVTGMSFMFCGCNALTSLDLSKFNTSNVTSMSAMFDLCTNLKTLNIKNFDTSKVTSMGAMFSSCNELTSLDLSHFNTENVTSMGHMFNFCSNLTSLNVSSFNTTNVTNMACMFQDCHSLTSLDLSSFRTDNVTSMLAMFGYCTKLQNLDISHFNTENVTNMNCMFELCLALKSLDLTHFNTSNVTDMNRMFYLCSGLTNLQIGNFDTRNVTDMKFMFAKTNNLQTLDLSSFDTSNVTAMDSLFCSTGDNHLVYWWSKWYGYSMPSHTWTEVSGSKLTTIYASNTWTTANVEEDDYMFVGCTALKGGKGTTYNASNVKKSYARIDGGNAAPGYFTEKSYILGDADGDTKVDVNDVTSTINYILNKPVAKFIKEAADMDKDGKIDVNDVQAIIYKALGK